MIPCPVHVIGLEFNKWLVQALILVAESGMTLQSQKRQKG
jgi:hypothetical protein